MTTPLRLQLVVRNHAQLPASARWPSRTAAGDDAGLAGLQTSSQRLTTCLAFLGYSVHYLLNAGLFCRTEPQGSSKYRIVWIVEDPKMWIGYVSLANLL